MRRRDQNILSREPSQQLIPRRRSRSLVDIENRGDLGMLQLDALCIDDWFGATKRVPLAGLDVRRCDGLRTLEERLRILRRLSSDFRRQPKVAFRLREVNIGVWKDAPSILSCEAADVIGMEVLDQNEADFFRGVACAAEAARPAPESSTTPPGAGARIHED